MVSKPGVLHGLRGKARIRQLRAHRLMVFMRVFEDYMDGKCSAEYVAYRWRLLKQAGYRVE